MTSTLLDNIFYRTTDLHPAFHGKKVFIAGRGFFGHSFALFFDHLKKKGIDVSVQAGSRPSWDINNPSTYTDLQKDADFIINAAGSASAQIPEHEIIQQHLAGPINLRSYTKPGAVLLQLSSGAAIVPQNAYGSCKQAAENHLLAMGGKTQIVRLFATIGPNMPIDTHFAIPTFVRNTLQGHPVRAVPGIVRSFAHICDSLTQCLHIMVNGDGRPYEVGSDDPISIEEAANLISENVVVAYADFPTNAAVARYVADLTRVKNHFNLTLDWSSKTAILATWNHFRSSANASNQATA